MEGWEIYTQHESDLKLNRDVLYSTGIAIWKQLVVVLSRQKRGQLRQEHYGKAMRSHWSMQWDTIYHIGQSKEKIPSIRV